MMKSFKPLSLMLALSVGSVLLAGCQSVSPASPSSPGSENASQTGVSPSVAVLEAGTEAYFSSLSDIVAGRGGDTAGLAPEGVARSLDLRAQYALKGESVTPAGVRVQIDSAALGFDGQNATFLATVETRFTVAGTTFTESAKHYLALSLTPGREHCVCQ